MHIDLIHFRHDSDGDGRRVNPAAGLGDGNTLHTVDPRLELEVAVGAHALYKRDDSLITPANSFRGFDHIDFEALDLSVLGIHAEQRSGKESRLITARPGADFEKQALLVSRVFGNEQLLSLLFDLALVAFELLMISICGFDRSWTIT